MYVKITKLHKLCDNVYAQPSCKVVVIRVAEQLQFYGVKLSTLQKSNVEVKLAKQHRKPKNKIRSPLPKDLYHGVAILFLLHPTHCNQAEAGRNNSLVLFLRNEC